MTQSDVSPRTATPIGALLRGLVAGALGTAAMDALWFARYRRQGGDSSFVAWELSSGLCSWDQAPAPAQALVMQTFIRRGRSCT